MPFAMSIAMPIAKPFAKQGHVARRRATAPGTMAWLCRRASKGFAKRHCERFCEQGLTNCELCVNMSSPCIYIYIYLHIYFFFIYLYAPATPHFGIFRKSIFSNILSSKVSAFHEKF